MVLQCRGTEYWDHLYSRPQIYRCVAILVMLILWIDDDVGKHPAKYWNLQASARLGCEHRPFLCGYLSDMVMNMNLSPCLPSADDMLTWPWYHLMSIHTCHILILISEFEFRSKPKIPAKPNFICLVFLLILLLMPKTTGYCPTYLK